MFMFITRKSTNGSTWILAILWVTFVITLGHAASKPTDAKPPIPPDLSFISESIADEANAIYLWRRAAKVQKEPNDNIREIITYAWQPEAPIPNDEKQTAIKHWLEQNQEALQLMDLSLKKPQAKWLAQRGEELQPELAALGQLAKARAVIADRHATLEKWDEAATLLEGNLRLAQIAIESEAALLHYFLGSSVRTITHKAILRLANHRNTPTNTLHRLLAALPALDTETNAFANSLRVEFTIYTYPTTDMNWFADAWSKREARNLVSLMYDEEFQRPFMVLSDPGLVALHPKPYDELAALERVAATYRRYRTNVFSLWTNRFESDEEAIEKLQTELLEAIEPLMKILKDDPLPLDQKGIAKARKLYLSLTDPIGRILQCKNSFFSVDDVRVFKNRTEREAVRAILAAIIFEREKEHLPVSLKELREAQLLADSPWDFFANAPLNYSKEKRLIWSVGEDAEDDDGDGSVDAPWSGFDATWKIPTRIK